MLYFLFFLNGTIIFLIFWSVGKGQSKGHRTLYDQTGRTTRAAKLGRTTGHRTLHDQNSLSPATGACVLFDYQCQSNHKIVYTFFFIVNLNNQYAHLNNNNARLRTRLRTFAAQ